jgi:hypothetical protein
VDSELSGPFATLELERLLIVLVCSFGFLASREDRQHMARRLCFYNEIPLLLRKFADFHIFATEFASLERLMC